MSFENIYDLFVSSCMKNNIVFTTVDILNFSNCCNVAPNPKELKNKIKNTNFQNYNQYKPFLGPVVFCPKNIQLKNANYSLSKIMLEMKLENEKISNQSKMQKIVNYLTYIN